MKIFEINLQGLEEHTHKQKTLENGNPIDGVFITRKPLYIEDNIAYIHVFGVLKNDVSELESRMGYTSYKQIKSEIDQALALNAQLIVLKIDSNGGESIGSEELTQTLVNLPVVSYAVVDSGVCMSAAYKIATGCTYIIGSTSSEFGSIGSIVSLLDTKEPNNKIGAYMNIFTNEGAYIKGIGSDFGSLSEEQKEFMQNRINKNGKKFQEIVKRNRPNVDEQVFSAAFYDAETALSLGLIDAIF